MYLAYYLNQGESPEDLVDRLTKNGWSEEAVWKGLGHFGLKPLRSSKKPTTPHSHPGKSTKIAKKPKKKSTAKRLAVLGFILTAAGLSGFAYWQLEGDPNRLASQTSPIETPAITDETLRDDIAGLADEPAEPTPTATPAANLKKSTYAIALYGDSMVDALGSDLAILQQALAEKYPQTTFKLYNYGVGAQTVQDGFERFAEPLDYQDRQYPPLSELKPDVLIIGSYGYTPFDPHYRDLHWLNLTNLVEQAKTVTPNVYLMAEIAPLRDAFGVGSLDWPLTVRREHAKNIKEQLENALNLSKDLKLPLIDAYSPTIVKDGFGSFAYTDQKDGISPSPEGKAFILNLIAETIKLE
jgi:hypothetical protein